MASQNETRDPHRNPVGGAVGAHPVGATVGGITGGAAAGALAGTVFGPIGTLVGAGIGVVAGAALGTGVAERIEPTGETEYWRSAHPARPYARSEYDFDRDYSVAYDYGLQARERYGSRGFDDVEPELRAGWNDARGESRLDWDDARPAVRDAFIRSERTYRTYEESDRYFESRFGESTYAAEHETFDDYRPAYRYGLLARSRYGNREWDEELERELGLEWERNRGDSNLSWERALFGVREAFTSPYYVDYNSPFDDRPDYREGGDADEGLFRVR